MCLYDCRRLFDWIVNVCRKKKIAFRTTPPRMKQVCLNVSNSNTRTSKDMKKVQIKAISAQCLEFGTTFSKERSLDSSKQRG